jgi:hypothetical protein
LAAFCVLATTACGQGGQHRSTPGSADNEVCRLLSDTTTLFGANASVVGYRGIDQMGPSCEFASADGARNGEIVIFTSQSLGAGVTPAAKMQEVLQKWDAQTETPLAPVAGLGEGAQMATDLPGYQTQIAFIKNNTLVLIQARTSDAATSGGAELARRLAMTAAASMP